MVTDLTLMRHLRVLSGQHMATCPTLVLVKVSIYNKVNLYHSLVARLERVLHGYNPPQGFVLPVQY